MSPNPIKLKVGRWEIEGLLQIIKAEIAEMEARIYQLQGNEYLVFKVLVELELRFVHKVKRSDRHDRQYAIQLDKAEAWVLFFHFNGRIEEYHPVKNLLGVFHQQLI